jgi:hypothetical protein
LSLCLVLLPLVRCSAVHSSSVAVCFFIRVSVPYQFVPSVVK